MASSVSNATSSSPRYLSEISLTSTVSKATSSQRGVTSIRSTVPTSCDSALKRAWADTRGTVERTSSVVRTRVVRISIQPLSVSNSPAVASGKNQREPSLIGCITAERTTPLEQGSLHASGRMY